MVQGSGLMFGIWNLDSEVCSLYFVGWGGIFGLDIECLGVGTGHLVFRAEGLLTATPIGKKEFALCAAGSGPGTNPGTGTTYRPTAPPTVGPYALPVPEFVPGLALPDGSGI